MTEVVPVLRVADARAGAAFYAHLGFRLEWEHTFEPGFPIFASIGTDDGAHIFLSEHTGDARPDTLLHLWVDDVDSVYERLRAAAADVTPPTDQEWGREIEARDPDGNRLRIGTRAAG
jgi:catechol 2,3-dioxygenase-like lactoylglutathione lyase family enzyme